MLVERVSRLKRPHNDMGMDEYRSSVFEVFSFSDQHPPA
jgi:hypothetical protein